MQLLPSLVSGLKAVCATFPDTRKGRGGNIDIADFGLSAFAMFFMQGVSFLAFQRALEKGHGRSNAQTLFEIGRIPSDNYIRDMLDEADPALLQPCFERMETLLAEPSHAAGLRSAGRQNPDRLGRNRVFLLAKARLSELSHPRALQRQNRELSLPAVGHRRGARPFQGRCL